MNLHRSPHGVSTATCEYCGLPVAVERTDGPVYCCYGCQFASSIVAAPNAARHNMGPESALGFSVFFTMNVVMLTMALWSYADQGQTPFQIALGNFLRYGAMSFSLPVLFLLGRPLLSHAVSRLRQGILTTDLLLSTGVLAAFGVSIINTLRGTGHVYFEVGCVILVLVTLGRWLEATGRFRASEALDQLERLMPEVVRRVIDRETMMTPRDQIVVGDCIRVLAGERIPVDGRLLSGRGVVDEQFFTGESVPVEKQPGDTVLGGTLNLDGDLVVEVTVTPESSALGRLLDAVRSARLLKGRYQLLSDQWSRAFFPIISAVAVCAFVYHGSRHDWNYGLLTALSVILIACPCSLALATPLAVWTALGAAAQRGVLCRSGSVLESMAAVRAIRWDKTGTLTTGIPRVHRLICESPAEESDVATLVSSMTSASLHPFSRSIHEFLADVDTASTTEQPIEIPCVRTIAGRGLSCQTERTGIACLGSVTWLSDQGMILGPRLREILSDPESAKYPVVAIGIGKLVRGLFLLEETIRPQAAEAIAACRQRGIDLCILTGDRFSRAAQLGDELCLAVKAELLPDAKLEAIRSAHERFGHVAMVGDGLNDAPALAAADVGIALGCGADVSRDSADICLLSSDLRLIPWLFDLSNRMVRTIRTNLFWSFAYNGIGVVVAASGQLHPALAAGLMVASSLMVLANSLRLSASLSGTFPGNHGSSELPEQHGQQIEAPS